MFVDCCNNVSEHHAVIGGDRRPVHDLLVNRIEALPPFVAARRQVARPFGHHRFDELVRIASDPKLGLVITSHLFRARPDMGHRLVRLRRPRKRIAWAHRWADPLPEHQQKVAFLHGLQHLTRRAIEKTAGGIRMTTIEDVETALRRCHRQLEFLGKLGEVA